MFAHQSPPKSRAANAIIGVLASTSAAARCEFEQAFLTLTRNLNLNSLTRVLDLVGQVAQLVRKQKTLGSADLQVRRQHSK